MRNEGAGASVHPYGPTLPASIQFHEIFNTDLSVVSLVTTPKLFSQNSENAAGTLDSRVRLFSPVAHDTTTAVWLSSKRGRG